jgi:hypothetical protein
MKDWQGGLQPWRISSYDIQLKLFSHALALGLKLWSVNLTKENAWLCSDMACNSRKTACAFQMILFDSAVFGRTSRTFKEYQYL